jgi:V/A-type H+/Na+-transporting ATPase subunit F
MHKVGVIGDKDSVLGFRALGFDVFAVEGAVEAEALLHRLAHGNYAVLYVTEQIAAVIAPAIAGYRNERFPAIIPIPGVLGNLGIGMGGVRQCVEKAVGADILFKD